MTTSDRSDRRARAVFWILSAVGAVSLVWRGRPQWFAFDDWTLLITRRDVWETSGILDFLLLPHNEHLVPGLTLWDVGLASIFGIDSYLPWTITIVAVLLGTAMVLRKTMLTIGVPPLLAAASAPVVMVWADFSNALTWAPETVFILYVALGLTHLLLVAPVNTTDRRAALGAAFSAVAILFHSGAALTTFVIVLVLVAARRWRTALWSCLPLCGYGLWLLTWGRRPKVVHAVLHRASKPFGDVAPTSRLDFARSIAGQGFDFIAGTAGVVVWMTVVIGGVVLAWRERRTAKGLIIAVLVGMSGLAVAAITVSRSNAFAISSPQSRYAVIVVLPLLPLIALELDLAARWGAPRLGRRRVWAGPVIVSLGAATFAAMTVTNTSRDTLSVNIGNAVREAMTAIVSTPSTRGARPDVGLMPVIFDIDVAGVWSLVDWDWYHPATTRDPDLLLLPQVRYLVAGGQRHPNDEPVTLRPRDGVGVTIGADRCVTLAPTSVSNQTLIVRGERAAFFSLVNGSENVQLRARRGDARSSWQGVVIDPTTPDVRILSDPGVDLVLRLDGPATFCDTSVS